MKDKTKNVFLVFLLGIMTSPQLVLSLTGLCETETGSGVCSACKSLSKSVSSLSRDCCGDPDAYAICSYCFDNPESCQQAGEILSDILNQMELFERRETRSRGSQPSLPYHVAPQRRAKYFLGKRSGLSSFEDEDDYDKRSSRHFLGKRGSRHFLGKRFDVDGIVDDDIDNFNIDDDGAMADKRVKLFLGKRDVSYTTSGDEANAIDADDTEGLWEDEKSKRKVSPFLGKRADLEDKLAGSTSDDDNSNGAKRGRPSPFLGKRDPSGDESGLLEEKKRGSSFFLGKRADLNSDSVDKLEDIYVRPLSRRAKYFLGKRNNGQKRQKYFLGKRAPSNDQLLQQQHQQLALDHGLDKRQKFFLGKRSSL